MIRSKILENKMDNVTYDVQNLVELNKRMCEIQEYQVKNVSMINKAEPQVFSGDLVSYPAWCSAFDVLIDRTSIPDQDKLFLSNKYTSGKARNMIQTYVSMGNATGYYEARRLLHERFGNPVNLFESFQNRLQLWPKVTKGKDIQEFCDFVTDMSNLVRSNSYLQVFDSISTIKLMLSKLPPYTYPDWQKTCESLEGGQLSVSLGIFVTFLKKVSKRANDSIFGRDALMGEKTSKREVVPRKNDHVYATATDVKFPDRAEECPYCRKRHSVDVCHQLMKRPLSEREDFIFKEWLCFKCGKPNHRGKDCKHPKQCSTCQKQHMTILHKEPVMTQDAPRATLNGASYAAHQTDGCIAVSPIVPVYVKLDGMERKVKTFALIDGGSNVCFIRSDVCSALQAKVKKTSLNLSTVQGSYLEDARYCENLVCVGTRGDEDVPLPRMYVREALPVSTQVITYCDLNNLRYLDSIRGSLEVMGPNDKVGMIIGTNCPRGIYIVDIIHGPPNLPQAIQFVLGWTLQGLVPHKEETPYGRDFPPPDHSALNYGRDFPLSTVKEEPNSAVCQRVVAYGRDFLLNESKVPELTVDNGKVFGCSY